MENPQLPLPTTHFSFNTVCMTGNVARLLSDFWENDF